MQLSLSPTAKLTCLPGIDYLAFSAHKIYAPFECGTLVVRKGLLRFNSTEMESIIASGNENPGGIAALGKALMLLQRIGMAIIMEEEKALTRWLSLRPSAGKKKPG